jgi:hypothetical protein
MTKRFRVVLMMAVLGFAGVAIASTMGSNVVVKDGVGASLRRSLTSYGVLYADPTLGTTNTAALTNGQIVVGATSAAPAPQTISGDATLATTGVLTLSPGVAASHQARALGSGLTLSAAQTIDGVACVAGDVVLAVGQSPGSASGPWIVASGAWTRPNWWAHGSAIVPGSVIEVGGEGSSFSGWTAKSFANKGTVVDTDDPVFYPKTIHGSASLTSGSPSTKTVSNLIVSASASVAVTDTTAATAIKAVLTSGTGSGSLALAGPNTVTDAISYTITNW